MGLVNGNLVSDREKRGGKRGKKQIMSVWINCSDGYHCKELSYVNLNILWERKLCHFFKEKKRKEKDIHSIIYDIIYIYIYITVWYYIIHGVKIHITIQKCMVRVVVVV